MKRLVFAVAPALGLLLGACTNTAGSVGPNAPKGALAPAEDPNTVVALVNGEMFWRGELQAASAASITVPAEWTSFSLEDASAQANLADLGLGRYLLQDERDPFVGDYEAWLDAARSIEGPETIRINRSTSGDLYLIEVELEEAPDVLADRFRALTEGPDALVSRETLLDAIYADSTMLWGVVLHPETGRLLGQYIQLDLTARLGQDAIRDGYRTLTLETSDEQSVLFTGVNEPVDTTALPNP